MTVLMRRLWVFLVLLSFFFASCEPKVGKEVPQNRPYTINAALKLTKHARCRMDCRHITASEIQAVLEKGTINWKKSEPNGKPDPKYAVEGTTNDGQLVRVIVAPKQEVNVIITVIDLQQEWQCDCH